VLDEGALHLEALAAVIVEKSLDRKREEPPTRPPSVALSAQLFDLGLARADSSRKSARIFRLKIGEARHRVPACRSIRGPRAQLTPTAPAVLRTDAFNRFRGPANTISST
jgi:hypothetical protein